MGDANPSDLNRMGARGDEGGGGGEGGEGGEGGSMSLSLSMQKIAVHRYFPLLNRIGVGSNLMVVLSTFRGVERDNGDDDDGRE